MYASEAGRWGERYGALFLLIFASMLLSAVNVDWLGVMAIVVLGGTTLFALLVARAGTRAWRFTIILIPCGVVLGVVGRVGDARWAQITAALVSLILPIAAIGAILRRLIKDQRVNGRTIIGLLCVYLLVGMTFAALYVTIGLASREPFFAEVGHADPSDFTYFSFITLTTVGYGRSHRLELAPEDDLGHRRTHRAVVSGHRRNSRDQPRPHQARPVVGAEDSMMLTSRCPSRSPSLRAPGSPSHRDLGVRREGAPPHLGRCRTRMRPGATHQRAVRRVDVRPCGSRVGL